MSPKFLTIAFTKIIRPYNTTKYLNLNISFRDFIFDHKYEYTNNSKKDKFNAILKNKSLNEPNRFDKTILRT